MRRLQLLASVAVITAGLASYACGGSDKDSTVTDSPIEAPSDIPSGETPSTPSTPPPASSTPSDPNSSPPSSSGGTSGSNTSGGSQSSGGNGGGGGGGGGGGPAIPNSKCAADSFVEKEGNDALDAANVLQNASGSACGKLTAANDVDYFTFTMPADSNYLGFAGAYSQDGVDFEITVGDKTFKIGDTPEVRPGSKYTVKVITKSGKVPADYRFDVQILKK